MSITSIQKVIKVGSSAGVTIPVKELKRLDISIGQEVRITVEPVEQPVEHDALMAEYGAFKAQYGETLKNLADR